MIRSRGIASVPMVLGVAPEAPFMSLFCALVDRSVCGRALPSKLRP